MEALIGEITTNGLIEGITTLLIGGLVGGWLTAYIEHRKQIVSQIWEKRFDQYKKLWAISGHLPLWPKDDSVTYHKLYNICVGLKNWYFTDGGLLLSKNSRKSYGVLQEKLVKVAEKDKNEKITPDEYDVIRELFHSLRKLMTKDLSSRSKKLIS